MKHLDKIAHFSVSFVIVSLLSQIMVILLAVLLTFLIGVAKEFYDEYTYGGFSILDLGADILGILTFYLLCNG